MNVKTKSQSRSIHNGVGKIHPTQLTGAAMKNTCNKHLALGALMLASFGLMPSLTFFGEQPNYSDTKRADESQKNAGKQDKAGIVWNQKNTAAVDHQDLAKNKMPEKHADDR